MPQESLFGDAVCRIRDPLYYRSRPETRLVENATLDLLDPHRLAFYLDYKENENPSLARVSRVQQLHMLGLSYEGTPTLAAMLLFCAYPQGFFPQYRILAAAVDDTEWKDEKILEKKKMTGPVTDLFEQAVAFCRKYAPSFPEEAVSELILNALLHRDLSEASERTPNYIVIFSDRIEFWNPCAADAVPIKETRSGAAPEIPNPTIASIAQVLLDVPLQGKGIALVRSLCALDYKVEEQELCATLRLSSDAAGDEQSRLLEFCRIPRSRKEIAEFLHVSTIFYAMARYVRPLLNQNKLRMTLPGKPQSSLQRFVTNLSGGKKG